MLCINRGNTSIPYVLVRKPRVKNLSLQWKNNYVLCVAPASIDHSEVMAFLWQNFSWLEKQLANEKKRRLVYTATWPKLFVDGTKIPFMGRELTIRFSSQELHAPLRRGKTLWVSERMRQNLEQVVIRWLQQQGLRHALHWSRKITRGFGLKPRSIKLRNQKSRWGSCGVYDDLYLNWKLICFPRRVFMYVVVHEHCHIRYRHHGKVFWALVAKMMRDYKQQDKWLNTYGGLLSNS